MNHIETIKNLETLMQEQSAIKKFKSPSTNDSDDGLSDSTTTNNLGHLVPITRIVLTGGACAGKTTALATLSVTLEQMGFKVL